MRAGWLAAAALAVSPAAAGAASTWAPLKEVDPISGATRQGLAYKDGEDSFLVVCTHQRDPKARQRFWVAVMTGEPLGRATIKPVTYRIGEEEPTTSRWDYSPREIVPSWPMEDRHLVERIIAGKAEKIAFRLFLYDNRTHDVVVPIDEAARSLMAQTVALCRS